MKFPGSPSASSRPHFTPLLTSRKARWLRGGGCAFFSLTWIPLPFYCPPCSLGSLVSSYKDTNPIKRAPSSWSHLTLITSPKSHLQTPSHWSIRALTHEFGGNTNTQSLSSHSPGQWGHCMASLSRPKAQALPGLRGVCTHKIKESHQFCLLWSKG